jgi:transposase
LPEDLDAVALDERLFKREVDTYRPGRPESDWLEVHRERKRAKHVTLQRMWLEYSEAHPDGWGYTQFCIHAAAHDSRKSRACNPCVRLTDWQRAPAF